MAWSHKAPLFLAVTVGWSSLTRIRLKAQAHRSLDWKLGWLLPHLGRRRTSRSSSDGVMWRYGRTGSLSCVLKAIMQSWFIIFFLCRHRCPRSPNLGILLWLRRLPNSLSNHLWRSQISLLQCELLQIPLFIYSFTFNLNHYFDREKKNRRRDNRQKCLSTKICGCIHTFNWKAQINK